MQTIDEILEKSVTLSVECLDRIYLNGYMPSLQASGQLVFFMKNQKNAFLPSPVVLNDITNKFKNSVKQFAARCNLEIKDFGKKGKNNRKTRKDDIAGEERKHFPHDEGVYMIGRAQEKCSAYKAQQINKGKLIYFDYSRQSVYVNHYYFYFIDRDFGPAFIKYCSYAPWSIKICLNGHEWLKKQLENEGIGYEALDNGILSCSDPKRLKQLSQSLGPKLISEFIKKWLNFLPDPLTQKDHQDGYNWRFAIWQAEISRTDIFSRPLKGREFFEEVIRENLDLGRPDSVQLIFSRRITKATPGHFKTRVVTQGVNPSIHINYKSSDVKQYFKENRALRTETTINNTDDFRLRKDLSNLWELRKIGDSINRRLLQVERISQNCMLSSDSMEIVTHPTVTKDGQRASAFCFGNIRTKAVMGALILMCHLPMGFTNKSLREHVSNLMPPEKCYQSSQMSYDLRRLKLKGIVEKIKGTNRYQLTEQGFKNAFFLTKLDRRIFDQFSGLIYSPENIPKKLSHAFNIYAQVIDNIVNEAKIEQNKV